MFQFAWILFIGIIIHTNYAATVISVPHPSSKVINVNDFEQDFYREFSKYVTNKTISPALADMRELLVHGKGFIIAELPKAIEPPLCLRCRAVSHTFLKFNATNFNIESLERIANQLCVYLQLESANVCPIYIEKVKETMISILERTPIVDANHVCSLVFQRSNCNEDDRLIENFPSIRKTPLPPAKSRRATPRSDDDEELTLVHLSDVHYDPYYTPGSDTKCKEGVCCRGDQGYPVNGTDGAGYWGDYLPCDSPWHTVENIISEVKRRYSKIDLIYFTGDIVDHFHWNISIERNTASIRKFTNLLKNEFPNIPIYPVLGNHEGVPSNTMPAFGVDPNPNSDWLYKLISEEWAEWLPSQAIDTLKVAGYYSLEIRPGLILVALNNNFCYGTNLWLLHSTTYFIEHLQWLENVLKQAKAAGKRVHIISHIPSNEKNCFKGWAREYRKIVEQYSDTVVAIFNGHTHTDELNVYYATDDQSKAVNVAFNGGSGTSFAFFNSNFRAYKMDAQNYEVLDYDTWIFNLTEANLTPARPPRWFKMYSFKSAYNLPDLSPHSLDKLVKRLATDKQLLKTYWERKVKLSDYLLNEQCNDDCLRVTLCDIVFMVHGDERKCEELIKLG